MLSRLPLRRLAQTPRILPSITTTTTTTTTRRPFHHPSPAAFPRKDTQDKDSLSPRRTEGSLTGGDDAAAAMEHTAFDPEQTSPEEEQRSAERESGQVNPSTSGSDPSPLDVSAGNREVSKPRPEQEGGPQGSPSGGESGDRKGSAAGSPKKHGGDKTG